MSLSVCPCVGVRLFSDMIDNDITEPVSVAGYTPPRVNIQYTARSGSIISEVLSPPALNPFSRPVHSQILLPMSSCPYRFVRLILHRVIKESFHCNKNEDNFGEQKCLLLVLLYSISEQYCNF